MTIAILTPSRGRPERLMEMIFAINDTAWAPSDITVYVGLDDDDAERYEVSAPTTWRSSYSSGYASVHYLVRPRMRLAAWTNLLAEHAIRDGHTILGFLGDDHRPRTRCWDKEITTALGDLGSGLAYADDGLQGERLPTAPFWTADIVKALGFYYPPQLTHMFADNYWKRLADDLGRRAYLPHVLIEHMHPSAVDARGMPKAEADALNAENDSFYEADERAYNRLIAEQHPWNLKVVQAAIQ